MKLIGILTDYFSHPVEKTVNKTPNGICALCWGHERYDSKIGEDRRSRRENFLIP